MNIHTIDKSILSLEYPTVVYHKTYNGGDCDEAIKHWR